MKVGINTADPGSAIDDVRVLYIEHAGCLYRVWAPNGSLQLDSGTERLVLEPVSANTLNIRSKP